jgi:hypothetical protein
MEHLENCSNKPIQRASPRGRTKCRQGLNERRFEYGIASAGIRIETRCNDRAFQ